MNSTDRTATCTCCKATSDLHIFQQANLPVVCNELRDTREQALSVTLGDIDLIYCENCGSISNAAFDPERIEYDALYENALHFSEKFQAFAASLADRLVADYDLKGKCVAEIGCGDGYFLRLLRRRGAGMAVGYDPSMSDGRLASLPKDDGVTICPEYFGDQNIPDNVNALICRHVLEHIPSPVEFLTDIRAKIEGHDCVVYFEVPNAGWMLESHSLWDVIYEHVTYWTPEALETAFRKAGFVPLNISTDFNDQYLMIEARPANVASTPTPTGRSPDLKKWQSSSQNFGAVTRQLLNGWQERLSGMQKEERSAVLWGGGSKGVTFLNAVEAARQSVRAVVDVNERKQGKFVPGTAHPIVAPTELRALAPDLVIVANKIYLEEIRSEISSMGLEPEFDILTG